jgi:hypothetical protein
VTFATTQSNGRIALNTQGTANTIALTRTNQFTVNPNVTVDMVGPITGPTFGFTKLGAGAYEFRAFWTVKPVSPE